MHNEDQLLLLYTALDYKFLDSQLIHTALIHRSYTNEAPLGTKNNERLEFLGDAVLELIITEYLYENYPDRSEGELTSFRAAVVRTESLAETAEKLGLGIYIYMSKGEESSGGRQRPYILANTFEAILGAMYMDSNVIECKKFIAKNLIIKLPAIIDNRLDIDSKSKLQEIAQELYKFTPTYEVVSEAGPDHNRTFTVKVVIVGKDYGQGDGKSKQEAEQNAAREGLNRLKYNQGEIN